MRIGRKRSTVSAILTLASLSLHCGSSGGHSMLNSGPKIFMTALGLFTVFALSQIILEQCADARAGGGRSGGFRGSRSYQAPARPAQPTSPRREAAPTPQQPTPYTPAGGGFMRGLGTAILGGFLGSMLFSGIANAGFGGFGGSGFGLIEVLLMAGLAYFVFKKFRSPAVISGLGSMPYQDTRTATDYAPTRAPEPMPASNHI